MTQYNNIVVTNTLTVDDAKSIYESGCSSVVDLRCSPCQASRPIEEPVVRKLENYRIEYRQLPLDGTLSRFGRQEDLQLSFLDTDENVLFVTDIPSEIARDIFFNSESEDQSQETGEMLAVA